LDAYAVVVVRMRWSPDITCRSRIKYEGKVYQILPETFHDDRQANTIQFTAQAIINDK
jgi:head-tail adaptor